MKFFMIFSAVVLSLFSGERAQAAVFDETASYKIAASQKLGMMSEFGIKAGKGRSAKDIDLCKDITCPDKTPCTEENGEAVCRCTETSCGQGAECVNGDCVNCAKGEQCNCPDGKKADGKGACEAPNYCEPNPCRGTTPKCTQSSLMSSGYACGCTNTSCGAGNSCSVPCDALRLICVMNPADAKVLIYNCAPCQKGATDCRCPSGQVADGEGGCSANCTAGQTDCPLCADGEVFDGTECRMPCKGVKCPSGYECQNGDGVGCCVVKCQKGQTDCPLCSSGQIYDGTKCRMPCTGVTCPVGQSCINGTGKGCCVSDGTETDCSCKAGYTDMTNKTCPSGQRKEVGISCYNGPQCARCVPISSGGDTGDSGGTGDRNGIGDLTPMPNISDCVENPSCGKTLPGGNIGYCRCTDDNTSRERME